MVGNRNSAFFREKPMNVLQIISDQHIASCIGAERHPQVITPHLDRLAASGVRFRHAYTQNVICTPSRVSILSGQYCHNHGYYGLSGPRPRLPSFLSHFKSQGYLTAGIGKLHTPNVPEDWLLDHCDHYAECYDYTAGLTQNSAYFEFLRKHGVLEQEDSIKLPEFPGLQQNESRPSKLRYEHSVEGWCAAQAIEFMERAGETRFCMQVSLPRPHQCYTPDQSFWDLYDENLALPPGFDSDASHRAPHFQEMVAINRNRNVGFIEPRGHEQVSRRVWRGYLACITQVDFAVGQMLDYLDRSGKAANTIVIYHSDHGAYSGTHGLHEKAPGICSESVCRVPMIWRVPGVTPAGAECREFVENIDLAPTITSLCSLSAMPTVDGKDITGLLKGDAAPVREVAVTENPLSRSIRWKQWRFVHYPRQMFEGRDIGELYDIDADPNETRNFYHDLAHREVVAECRNRLLDHLISTTRVATIWPPVAKEVTGAKGYDFQTCEDGKEANTAGAALRVARKQWWYI